MGGRRYMEGRKGRNGKSRRKEGENGRRYEEGREGRTGWNGRSRRKEEKEGRKERITPSPVIMLVKPSLPFPCLPVIPSLSLSLPGFPSRHSLPSPSRLPSPSLSFPHSLPFPASLPFPSLISFPSFIPSPLPSVLDRTIPVSLVRHSRHALSLSLSLSLS